MKKKIIIIACICACFASVFCSCKKEETELHINMTDTEITDVSNERPEASELTPDSPVDDDFIEDFNIQNIKMAFENIFLKVEIQKVQNDAIFIIAENESAPYMKSIVNIDSERNITVIELMCLSDNTQPAQSNTMALVSLLQYTGEALCDSGIDVQENIKDNLSDIPESAFKKYMDSNAKEEYYWEEGITSLVYTIPDPNNNTYGMFTYTILCNPEPVTKEVSKND